jgi:Domain of unknown function (DUF4260)
MSLPSVLLRLEGAALLAVAAFLYARSDASWLLFALLLLAPDVGMVGYLRGSRAGAVLYNLFHTSLLPAGLAVVGVIAESRAAVAVALIWLAHIGMDRALGFGLKYPTEFRDTHLGRV